MGWRSGRMWKKENRPDRDLNADSNLSVVPLFEGEKTALSSVLRRLFLKGAIAGLRPIQVRLSGLILVFRGWFSNPDL